MTARERLRRERDEIHAADTRKKATTCLGCGAAMFTDRLHRRCPACRRKDANDDRRTPAARTRGGYALAAAERERLWAAEHEDVANTSGYTHAGETRWNTGGPLASSGGQA